MKHKQFWSDLFLNSQDEKLVAHAQAEYYRSLATRVSDIANSFGLYMNGEDIPDTEKDTYIVLNNVPIFSSSSAESETLGYQAIALNLRSNPVLQNILNDETRQNETGDFIVNVQVTDAWGNEYYVDIDDICDILGSTIDESDIIATGYEAIDQQSWDTFYSKMNAVYKEVSTAISSLIDTIGVNINNSNLTVRQRLAGMDSVTSMNIGAQLDSGSITASDIVAGTYDGVIAKCTGTNPVLVMLNGLPNVRWDSFVNVLAGIGYYSYVLPYEITVWQVKAIGKGFSWLGNLFKKTFVDPVDYSITKGDKIEYSINTAVWQLPFAANSDTYAAIHDYMEVGQSVWFSLCNVTYRVTLTEDTVATFEQWVKPTSPEGLRQLFNKSAITSLSSLTYQNLYDIFTGIPNIEAMDKKSPEKDVFYGLLLSETLSDLLLSLMYGASTMYNYSPPANVWFNEEFDPTLSILDYCMDHEDYVLGPETLWGWSSITRGTSTCTPRVIDADAGYDLFSQLNRVVAILNYYNGNNKLPTIQSAGSSQFPYTSRGKNMKTASSSTTITNADFIWTVTSDPYGVAFGYGTDSGQPASGIVSLSDDNIYRYNVGVFPNVDANWNIRNAWGNPIPNLLLRVLELPYRRKVLIGTELQDWALLLIAYTNAGLDIEQNLSIKTDADNMAVVIGALVAALVVVAAVVGVKSIGKYKDKMCQKAYQLNCNTNALKKKFVGIMNLPNSTPKQKQAAARAYRRALAKQNRFARLKGSYGFTSALGSSKIAAAGTEINTMEVDEIINLIRQ